MDKNLKSRKYSPLFYRAFIFYMWVMNIFVRHTKCDLSKIKGIKGPFVIVAPHHSSIDGVAVPFLFGKYDVAVVGTRYFYFIPKHRFAQIRLGVIPKAPFASEVKPIKEMMAAIKSGRSLLIFPEGQITLDGRSNIYEKSIVKMLKKMKINVVSVSFENFFSNHPSWAKYRRNIKTKMSADYLIKEDEFDTITDEEILKRLDSILVYDVSQELAKNPQKIKCINPMEGITNALYKCPACNKEFALICDGKTLVCNSCQNTVTMDEYGFLVAATEKDKTFKTVALWNDFQRETLKEEYLNNNDYSIETEAIMQTGTDYMEGLIDSKPGTLVMTDKEFIFTTEDGELRYKNTDYLSQSFAVGVNISIPIPSQHTIFKFDNPSVVSKFVNFKYVLDRLRNS